MTKYILAGGNDRQYSHYWQNLANEVHNDLPVVRRIVSCFFADPEPWQWAKRAESFEPWFREYFGSGILYEYAIPEALIEQVKQADLIYIHGGDNKTLIDRLRDYNDLPSAFSGKVVVGSSAGANYISEKYWTRSKSQVDTGCQVVPYGIMVHFGSPDGGYGDSVAIDWNQAEKKLRQALPADCEIAKIKEGEFIVVEQ